MAKTRNAADLTGRKFGRLLVQKRLESDKAGHARWNCLCECGNSKTVLATNIIRGITQSCGCLHKERTSAARITHGATVMEKKGSRLYQIWAKMKQRCSNPNPERYHRYGGRGIRVCVDWSKNYQTFHDWAMANGYADNLTIDRIDNDGDYTPDNCQWLTGAENNRKRFVKSEVPA